MLCCLSAAHTSYFFRLGVRWIQIFICSIIKVMEVFVCISEFVMVFVSFSPVSPTLMLMCTNNHKKIKLKRSQIVSPSLLSTVDLFLTDG